MFWGYFPNSKEEDENFLREIEEALDKLVPSEKPKSNKKMSDECPKCQLKGIFIKMALCCPKCKAVIGGC